MKASTEKTIKLIADIVLTVMILISALLLSIACLAIYGSAESQMYTYERIGAAWEKIAIPIYITLAMIAIRAVWACAVKLRDNGKDQKRERRAKRMTRTETKKEDNKHKALVNGLRLGIVAIAAIFIVIGVLNGGMQDVLKKAAEICAECIGLG